MRACLDYACSIMGEAAVTESDGRRLLQCLPSETAARQLVNGALRYVEPCRDIAYRMVLVEARVEFRNLGYMRSDNRRADEISRRTLETSVRKALRMRSVRMNEWWTALNIEAYIQRKMGVLPFSRLQRSLLDDDSTGSRIVSALAQILAPRAVCFGNGPRWSRPHVIMLVDTWVQGMNDLST